MWNVNKNLLYTQLLVTPWDMDSLLFEVVCVCVLVQLTANRIFGLRMLLVVTMVNCVTAMSLTAYRSESLA